MTEIFLLFTTFFFFFFCVHLWKENNDLKIKNNNLLNEIKKLREEKIALSLKQKDVISISTLNETKETKQKDKLKNDNLNEENTLTNFTPKSSTNNSLEANFHVPIKPTFSQSTSRVFEDKKNDTPPSSPIHLNEFIKQDNESESNMNTSKNRDYLEKLSNRLEQEAEPKTIELTEYEKNQEENAVISYHELLSLKGKEKTDLNANNKELLTDLKKLREYLEHE